MASAMECKEAKQKLSEALDADLESAEKANLDDHLESCAGCKMEASELQQVHELVSDLADPAVDPPSDDTAWNRIDMALGSEAPGDRSPFEPVDEEALVTSGVMDIKDMVTKSAGAAGAGGEAKISTQDFFGLGSSGGGEAQPAAVAPPPVLMPVAQRPAWLIPVAVAGGVVVLSVLALGVVLFVGEGRKAKKDEAKVAEATDLRKSPDKAAAKEEEAAGAEHRVAAPAPASGAGAGPGRPLPADSASTPARPEASRVPLAGTEPGSTTVNGAKTHGRGRRRYYRASSARRGAGYLSGGSRRARMRRVSRKPGSPPTSARPSASISEDPLSHLLGAAKARGAARPAARPTTSLPHNLSRAQIRKVMSRASGSVKKCFETHKQPGLLRVSIAIKGSTGRIVSVAVKGKFKGTPTARCALRTIRRLKFPRFATVTQRFTYPFLLR